MREGRIWAVDSTVEKLAKWLLFALTQLPGRPSFRQKTLGQALFKFFADKFREDGLRKELGRTCQFCHKENPDVYERRDPYLFDVENEEVMVAICDDCYSDRCDDI